jgi:integrase
MTVVEARKLTTEAVAAFQRGDDPREQKRRDRNSATLGDLFAYCLQHHAKQHKRTWRDDQAQYDRYLKKGWGSRKLNTIGRPDVQRLHVKIGEDHGHYAANRLRSLLHKMFALAIDDGLHDGPDPVQGVARYREKSRDRFLVADELKAFFGALADEENEMVRDYLLLALLVGARRSNLRAMRWEDIDLQRVVWTVPDTKAGDSLVLPLSPAALDVLSRRAEQSSGSPWVFPAPRSKAAAEDRGWQGSQGPFSALRNSPEVPRLQRRRR